MKYSLYILAIFLSFSSLGQGIPDPNIYRKAYKELSGMLTDSIKSNFKRAVFISENAYLNNSLSYEKFEKEIKLLASFALQITEQGNLDYNEADKEQVKKYWAVYSLMTDSIKFTKDGSKVFSTIPYSYDFDDFWGEKSWRKMFVTKLLETHTGNCHSLPFLYKILCEELGAKAWLSMAPNHTYIKLWTKKTGWFNTELTSGYFPIDAWIMASGYIHLSAIQNRVFMDTLSTKQSIAVCMTDLAKGFEKKFGDSDLDFILKCTDTALKYYPLYTNALILKAETLKKKFEKRMKIYGAAYPSDTFADNESKKLFDEMESLYFHIHQIGYRMMPAEMYVSWLTELNKEKEKYSNQNVINSFRPNK